MSRPHRVQLPGITYHIYSRCIEKRSLLNDEFASELLVAVMQKTQKKYDFELISYQIMENHFHFVIRTLPDGAPISRIVQYIKARFAERYNAITGRTGPLWNERYKDSIVENADDPEQYLLWLLWYIAFNPVRKYRKGNPRAYKYSSINCYLDENYKSPLQVTLHSFFIKLGNTFEERVKSFLFYEDAYRKRWAIIF